MTNLANFFLVLLCSCACLFSNSLYAATGQKAMVATQDPHATEAALQVLQQGGNAVDAAIAAQWVLNVVEPQGSGIGGGGFFLYYEKATKRVYFFDGRETAPRHATPGMFLDGKGVPYPYEPDRITGGLPVGVPGVLKLLHTVHERLSSKKFTFGELFDPAIDLAEHGFPVSPRLAKFLVKEKDRLKLFEETRRIFFNEQGNVHAAGYPLKQPDLANTFRLIQQNGINIFYEGDIAKDIVRTVKNAPFHPGLMELEDLLYYRAVEREPVHGEYRGYDVLSVGPPSSGGTTLIEALNILGFYTLSLHGRTPDGFHLFAEAQKLAFQDRNVFLGDPDFSRIPLDRLLSKEFAKERVKDFTFEMAMPPPENRTLAIQPDGKNTSHISIVDADGNMVAFTTTIEAIFGCGMVVPGRGFFLNNELTDFEALPKDEKGKLVANAPEPEKRPRSSMTPVLIFHEGSPYLILGSPGGSRIIAAVLNVIVNMVDFGMKLEDALAAPRLMHRNGPLEMEAALYEDLGLRKDLQKRGHKIEQIADFGNIQAIHFEDDGTLTGASDPRGAGEAKGY